MPDYIPGGYTLLSRTIIESNLWLESDKTLRVAIYLLAVANHAEGKVGPVTVSRGQTYRTLSRIAEENTISIKSVRTCLDRLCSIGFIVKHPVKGARTGQRITICTYEAYQCPDNYIGQADGPKKAPNKNDKNDKKEKKTTNNHPRDLAEMMDYCRTQLHWNISDDSARSIWNYYCPPGGDEVWRDRKGGLVVDWHKRMVTCRKNDTTPQREDPEETLKRLQAKGYC